MHTDEPDAKCFKVRGKPRREGTRRTRKHNIAMLTLRFVPTIHAGWKMLQEKQRRSAADVEVLVKLDE